MSSKATETRKTNAERRKAKTTQRNEMLNLMIECLTELLEDNVLSDEAKFKAVCMLDEIRHEMGFNHSF